MFLLILQFEACPNGRVSLYGSYWNLAGNASSSSTSGLPVGNRQSPFSQYSTQQVFLNYLIFGNQGITSGILVAACKHVTEAAERSF
ncbi:unnamed protein product [Brugia timori]|uniref:Uncharacterized protein n=1 Tax=Brugia timori TaxID=42155 RepID=A0A3P7X488_9BILA|nr:unnamed protein product [Brugia timori]